MTDQPMEDWAGEVGDRWLAHLDRFESMIAPVGAALMDRAGFRPGEGVVDIGCGGGATTLEIARRVGPEGRAEGVDIAAQLVARATERAAAMGATNAAFQTLDAETGRPGGAPFDRAFSRFGVMFFEDTGRAFANMRGWLAPGGRFDFACWAPPDQNPWFGAIGAIVGEFVEIPQREPDQPGPFRMADADATRAMLEAAGFTDVALELWRGEQHVGGEGADPDAAAEFALAGLGVGQMIADQAPDRLDEAKARIRDMMAEHYRDGAVRMPAASWLVSARNPE